MGEVMAIIRNWTGGEHNFYGASSWTPAGQPMPGDTVIIGPGSAKEPSVATVNHHTVAGITVLFDDGPGAIGSPYVPTLSLNGAMIGAGTLIENQAEESPALGASDTEAVLIKGTVRNFGTIAENPGAQIGNTLNITLADRGTLVNGAGGTISGTTISQLNIEGGSHSVVVNQGTISGQGTTLDIGVPVIGHGLIDMSRGGNPGSHFGTSSTVEFHQAVGNGQTIQLNDSTLILDAPMTFLGTINDLSVSPNSAFATNSAVLLKGEHATDLSFNNDVLSVRNGSDLLASLHFLAGLGTGDFLLTNNAQGAFIGIVTPTASAGTMQAMQSAPLSFQPILDHS